MPAPTFPAEPPCPLLCLGNLSVDDVVQPDGLDQPGALGGDALYGVLAARLFQPRAEMVAPIGHDLPDAVRNAIGKAGLSVLGLVPRPVPSLRNRIRYLTHDERVITLLSSERDFDTLSPRGVDIPQPFWQAAGFMILAMTLPAQQELIAAIRARRGSAVVLALDPQEEYIAGNKAEILAMLHDVDLFMPSLGEVRALLGHADPARAAQEFARHGPRLVVVKLGAEGCLVHDAAAGRDIRLPAHPARVLDTTGAGDAFCAAFLAAYLGDPDDLMRAAAAGSVAAAIAVSGLGPAGLLAATPQDAQAMLQARLGRAS